MASAQVLSNPVTTAKKQEHLEAGKRRLEEFRKKKAADRAKKAASASHLHTANADLDEQQPLHNQHARLNDSNEAVTSDRVRETIVEPSREVIDDENIVNEFQNNEIGSYDTRANPPLRTNYYHAFSTETVEPPVKDQDFERHNALQFAGTANVNYSAQPQEKNDHFSISAGASGRHAYGSETDQSVPFGSRLIREIGDNSGQPRPYGLEEAHSVDNDSNMKDFVVSSATSHAIVSNSPENSSSSLLQTKFGYTNPQASGLASSLYEDSFRPSIKITESSSKAGENTHAVLDLNNNMTFDMGERKFSDSVGHFPSGNSIPLWPSESRSTAFSSGVNGSSNHVPLYPAPAETNTRRSRPSFLDSINLPKVPLSEPGKVDSYSSKVHEMELALSASQKLFAETDTGQPFSALRAPNVLDMYGHNVNENSMERKQDSYFRKQDEDFAALEQHIEDLTQEKFSLQRALEASRALADSLAAENSSLTDSYNQQGSVVNQLKSDMERFQAAIEGQLTELEAVKMEYANAQLECNAADERAKLLASEVIGLEEKALRLRSSELKLERQLENSQAEISSCKKKISSLEKERQDFQSTIDALQEEKKLLQAKLRKASVNGKFNDVGKSLANKKHVSTSTEDLIHEDDTNATEESSNMEMHGTARVLRSDATSSSLVPENGQFNLEASYLNVPPDQMRTIQNIHTLISELALEKGELTKALLAESSETSKLKELNDELSRKLEAQTQRLELLTAQSMANENIPIRPPDHRSLPDNTPYADEGDEVVERVLGWIMKLFPGGPSRRRTSKLL
ncbi:Myosin heavy chain, striated muscle like [Actinidia chinensis var. chinensis]|uniref:Myosin heavy chain, striated muscle like n=1 Tax=Actinidia chinensis var. chinensis TaxID=1590841 RepID=A0A2R6PX65_ACTCC|nr:Myosin heavy chain, striated muscle like [Actinidia chinensis var. chinensis]